MQLSLKFQAAMPQRTTTWLQDNDSAKLHLGVVICSFFIKVSFVNAVTLREPDTRKEVSKWQYGKKL